MLIMSINFIDKLTRKTLISQFSMKIICIR